MFSIWQRSRGEKGDRSSERTPPMKTSPLGISDIGISTFSPGVRFDFRLRTREIKAHDEKDDQ